jgi:hypothetical protein
VLDYFSQPGTFTLHIDRLTETQQSSIQDQATTIRHISRALRLIEALRILPTEAYDADLARITENLTTELTLAIEAGAETTNAPQLAQHLQLRAMAFSSGEFEEARRFGAATILPVEIILGPVPKWRSPDDKMGLSGVLAIPANGRFKPNITKIDENVELLARQLLVDNGFPTIDRSFEPPIYSICDLIDMAGEAARFPHHFANFLPEDEGILGETAKTVVYVNYYIRRFFTVSLPLLQKSTEKAMPPIPEDEATSILLTWFRAHDVAHSYFDNLCRRAGLEDRYVHVMREIIADLVGFAVAATFHSEPAKVGMVLTAEALRYSRRDPILFADTMAARFELGSVLGKISLAEITDGSTFPALVIALLNDTIARLTHEDPAIFQRWIDRNVLAYQTQALDTYLPNDLIPIIASPNSAHSRAGNDVIYVKCSHA